MRTPAALVVAVVLASAAVNADPPSDPVTPAPKPPAGTTFRVSATAYCQAGKTRSGTNTRTGIVAADPEVLPVGSVVRVTGRRAYAGIYTVMDTGRAIKGPRLDIFVPDCARAIRFGRRPLLVRVLRRGWNPKDSAN